MSFRRFSCRFRPDDPAQPQGSLFAPLPGPRPSSNRSLQPCTYPIVSTPISISFSCPSCTSYAISIGISDRQRVPAREHIEQQKVHNLPQPSQLVQVQFLAALSTSRSPIHSCGCTTNWSSFVPSFRHSTVYQLKSNLALARTCCVVVRCSRFSWGFRFLSSRSCYCTWSRLAFLLWVTG